MSRRQVRLECHPCLNFQIPRPQYPGPQACVPCPHNTGPQAPPIFPRSQAPTTQAPGLTPPCLRLQRPSPKNKGPGPRTWGPRPGSKVPCPHNPSPQVLGPSTPRSKVLCPRPPVLRSQALNPRFWIFNPAADRTPKHVNHKATNKQTVQVACCTAALTGCCCFMRQPAP